MLRATSIALALTMLAGASGAAELGDEPVSASGPPVQIVPPPPAETKTETKFETFEDGEPRIMLAPADGGAHCRGQGPAQVGQDLRSVIFIDPVDLQDCFGPSRRRIETYAGLGDDALGAGEDCAAPAAVCATLAERLRLPKHRSRAVLRSDGWIDVIVVTKSDPALAPTALRYTIVLRTDQKHLTVDLRALTASLSAAAP